MRLVGVQGYNICKNPRGILLIVTSTSKILIYFIRLALNNED